MSISATDGSWPGALQKKDAGPIADVSLPDSIMKPADFAVPASLTPYSPAFHYRYVTCLFARTDTDGVRTMIVNASQDAMPIMPSAATTKQSTDGFLASLETAKGNLAKSTEAPSKTQTSDSGKGGSVATTKTALQELEEYLSKSPAQRMRDAILKAMGLTEDALNAMPPEQRASVEKTIAEKVKEYLLGHNTHQQPSGQPSFSMMTLLS